MDDDDEQRALSRAIRRHMLVLMLSITFAAGLLAGLLVSAVGLPGVWMPAMVLGATGVFSLVIRRP